MAQPSVNNAPIPDLRQDIYRNYILPLTQEENPILDDSYEDDINIINSFKIQEFKNDFNDLLNILKINTHYHIDDFYKDIIFYPNLSKTIKSVIYKSIIHIIKLINIDSNNSNNLTSNLNIDTDNIINLLNSFKDWFYNNILIDDDIGVIEVMPNPTKNTNIDILNKLIENNFFLLYNKIVKIELINTDNLENRNVKIIFKELSIIISKYFYLTEILLKMLLDTNYNNNNGTDRIINNFQDYNSTDENGLGKLHNYNIISSRDNSCLNNIPPINIINIMNDIILKNIYHLLILLNTKLKDLNTLTSEFIIDNSEITRMNNLISKLDNDKNKFIHYGKTLKDKKIYTTKNYNRNKRIFIIILILTILLVISNLYTFFISKSNSSVIFQINIIIIVVIIITKFYYLLK
jgi:hypothetical protein